MRASLIIPARNERDYIVPCIKSLISHVDPERDEIILVDGCSDDETSSLVEANFESVRIVRNPEKTFPAGVNEGIRAARGEFVLIIGAHAAYPPEYVDRCIELLEHHGADNAGMRLETRTCAPSLMADGVAFILSDPFGVGASPFRTSPPGIGVLTGVDTVFGGCYRRSLFESIGMLDERLIRTADKAFNRKLILSGGTIVMDTNASVAYYPRTGFQAFLRHAFRSGYWASVPLGIIEYPTIAPRQLIPAVFVSALLVLGAATLIHPLFLIALAALFSIHGLAAVRASSNYSGTARALRFLFLPPLFLLFHISFGAGFLAGLPRVLARRRGRRNLFLVARDLLSGVR